jgi:CBS domain-containing protein
MEKRGVTAMIVLVVCALLSSCSTVIEAPSNSGFAGNSPSIVYGKLVDQNNRPIAGETIIAEWIIGGTAFSAQTATLSKEEALHFGDASLEGAFLFSKGEIKAPLGTSITLKTLPRFTSVSVEASPGDAVDAGRMMLLRSTSPPLTSEEKNREIVEIVAQKEPKADTINAFLTKIRWWLFGAHLFILAAMAVALFFDKMRKRGPVSEFIFRKDMDSLETMRVEEIMAKEVIVISPNADVDEALELMMHHHLNGVVVAEEREVRGILTETDFLRKVHGDFDALKSKVRDVMTAPTLTVQSSATVLSVIRLMLKRGIRKIPVVKNGELVGIVSFTDMFKLFNKIFQKHPHEKDSELLENVQKCCQKEMIVVGREDTFGSIVKLMKEKNMSYVLVSGAGLSSDRGMIRFEEGMGIITTKDLLDELYKNPHGFVHLKAVNVMRTPLLTIDNSKNIAQALEMMEEHAIRRIPVRSLNRIAGMLTQPPLMSSLMEYLENTKAIKKK